MILIWPLVLFISIGMYGLTFLALPLSGTYATMFLFVLIGFWSRLPGSGFKDPTWLLYNLDLVDLFTLIITIHFGIPAGIAYVSITNILPRMCGIAPIWTVVLYNTVTHVICCFFLPIIYAITNNLLVAMIVYNTLRIILDMSIGYFLWPRPISVFISGWTMAICSQYFATIIHTTFFGNYFKSIVENGGRFDWFLFLFATSVMAVISIGVFGFSPKKTVKNIFRISKRITKKRKGKGIKAPHRSHENNNVKYIQQVQQGIHHKSNNQNYTTAKSAERTPKQFR